MLKHFKNASFFIDSVLVGPDKKLMKHWKTPYNREDLTVHRIRELSAQPPLKTFLKDLEVACCRGD